MREVLSTELKKFIASYVSSLEDLEVLLLMHSQPAREWDVTEISHELSIDPISLATRLIEFTSKGLVAHKQGAGKLTGYKYSPSSDAIKNTVDALAVAYKSSRIQVIDYVVSPFRDDLLKFADAFKFKKDNKDE
jgi:predicted transcriptional regulator